MLDPRPDADAGIRLRKLLDTQRTLAVPGVFNPLIAAAAKRLGFDALYLSGGAFSASL